MRKVLIASVLSFGCMCPGMVQGYSAMDVHAAGNVSGSYHDERSVNDGPAESTELSLNVSKISIALGDSYTLRSTVLPEEASQELKWSSSDEGIACVSDSGTVTAKGVGECIVTASMTDGSGLTAECRVRVVSPPDTGSWTFVDMGTSVMWATRAIGWFYFGAPRSVFSNTDNYSALDPNNIESEEWGGDARYDAATRAYGYNVHVPSKSEFEELLEVCTIDYYYDSTKGSYFFAIRSNVTGNTLMGVYGGDYVVGGKVVNAASCNYYTSTIGGVEDGQIQGYYFCPHKTQLGMEYAMQLQKNAANYGYDILPVYDPDKEEEIEEVKVEAVRLNAEMMTLGVGEVSRLEVTVEPENATNRDVEWSTTDEAVATVDADGTVEGIGQGTCEIRATAADGSGVTASCFITVLAPTPEMEYVDLGLSVMWGKYDLGAAAISEKGVYYAWGTVENANNYKGATARSYKMQPDGACTGVLRDPDDPTKPYDVATELLGADWHTPTKAEWQELIDNSKVTRQIVDGLTCGIFTSNINGNSLYLGSFGYLNGTSESPLMSTSVLRQTSDAPKADLTYDTKFVMYPTVSDLSRYCYQLVPIRPVCSNPPAAIGNVAVDRKPDGLFDVYDVSGRFVGGRMTYSEACERLHKGIYVFVGSDGRHIKVCLSAAQ